MLVFIVSTALTACGKTETSKTTAPTTKNFAVGTMTEGEVPVDVKVDVSTGSFVRFRRESNPHQTLRRLPAYQKT